jgi:hypothetical protein
LIRSLLYLGKRYLTVLRVHEELLLNLVGQGVDIPYYLEFWSMRVA